MATCDEKSGYEHIALSENSQIYFWNEFGGFIMVYTVLPFEWKESLKCWGFICQKIYIFIFPFPEFGG